MTGRNLFAPTHAVPTLSHESTRADLDLMKDQAGRAGGFLARIRIAAAANRHGVDVIEQGLVTYFAARRQEFEHRIMLGLDNAKKRAVQQSLAETALIEQEISRMTSRLMADLDAQVSDAIKEASLTQVRRMKELESLLASGQILKSRYDKEVERLDRSVDELISRVEAVTKRVIDNLGERLEAAMAVRRDG